VLGCALMCWREPERSLGFITGGVVAVAAGRKTFILNRTRVSLLYPTPGSGMAVSSHRNSIDAPSTPRSPALVSTYCTTKTGFDTDIDDCRDTSKKWGSMQIGRGQTMTAATERHVFWNHCRPAEREGYSARRHSDEEELPAQREREPSELSPPRGCLLSPLQQQSQSSVIAGWKVGLLGPVLHFHRVWLLSSSALLRPAHGLLTAEKASAPQGPSARALRTIQMAQATRDYGTRLAGPLPYRTTRQRMTGGWTSCLRVPVTRHSQC